MNIHGHKFGQWNGILGMVLVFLFTEYTIWSLKLI